MLFRNPKIEDASSRWTSEKKIIYCGLNAERVLVWFIIQ